MKYLIVKCVELDDQWECDASRTPLFITDDWEKNHPSNCLFEVYEIKENGSLALIKDYSVPMEYGMTYGYWDADEKFHEIERFKNRTRKDACPNHIIKLLKSKGDEYENCLKNCGYISNYKTEDKVYCYVEYHDNFVSTPY